MVLTTLILNFYGKPKILLNELLALLDVLDAELEGGVAAVVVLDDGVADVERVAGLDVVVEFGHVEGDGGDLVERLFLVDEIQFHVDTAGTDLAAVASVRDVLGQEDRVGVAGAERLELLQETEKFRSDLAELQLGVDVGHRGEHLLGDLFGDELVNPAHKLLQIALL